MGTSRLTRGGLSPARLVNLLDDSQSVDFMFNPQEFSISKTVNWEKDAQGKVDEPSSQFQGGQARELSLKLHFDTQESGSDVRYFTSRLWKMTQIDESTVDDTQKYKGNPPPVAFEWGSFYLMAVVTRLSVKYTLFDGEGNPVHAEVDISLRQQNDVAQLGATGATPRKQSWSGQPPSTVVIVDGDRIDTVAAKIQGSDHRQLAEKNNVDNPLKLQNGQRMRK